MSKSQLKKELQRMSPELLRELITDLYDARKEAKEYLDFFANPDIVKMTDRYRAALKKEISRTSRGRALPRMTRVRKHTKDYASFNPGAEYIADMMTFAVEQLCLTASGNWIKDATARSIARYLEETLAFIDRHAIVSDYLPRLTAAVDALPSGFFRNNYLRQAMRESIEAFASGISTGDK